MTLYHFLFWSSHLILPFVLLWFLITFNCISQFTVFFFGRKENVFAKQESWMWNLQTNTFKFCCSCQKKSKYGEQVEIMMLSFQISQTLRIKGKNILTGTYHHGEPWLPSTTVLATASPGILAPCRWGSLIRVGAHPRVLGIIKHCSFFWRGGGWQPRELWEGLTGHIH